MLLATLLFSATACGSATLTQTGPRFAPREENCQFQVFTTPPGYGFIEIGTIDMELNGFSSPRSIAALIEDVRPHVCQAGGDAVVAYANGYGIYIKASVLKAVANPIPPPAMPYVPPPQYAPMPTVEGCSYDAQCKGDRICVKGSCVESAPHE